MTISLTVERVTETNINLRNRQYSYSEVVRATDNFKNAIGEGGFGKVYLGIMRDETQVAIKLLSQSSKQGYKEFKAEVRYKSPFLFNYLKLVCNYMHMYMIYLQISIIKCIL